MPPSPRLARAALWALAALLALTVAGCGDGPVVLGLSGQLEGKYSDLGVQGRNGAMLAVEDVNARGGVDGRPLELLVRDDRNSPEGALRADAALADAGAVAVIGHFTSSQSLAAVPQADERGILLLSPTTSTPRLSGKDDMFLRVMGSSSDWASALARYAARRGAREVLLLRDQDNAGYTVPYTEAFARTLAETGGRATILEFSSAARTDWDFVLGPLASGAHDALLVAASSRDTADLARHLRVAGLTQPLYIASWALTSELLSLGGAAVEDIVSCEAYSDDIDTPALRDFRMRYRDRFGYVPSFAAVYAYEAVSALARALERTGGKARGLKRALLDSGPVDGLIGPFSFDRYGDALRPYSIVTIRNGRLTTLELAGE